LTQFYELEEGELEEGELDRELKAQARIRSASHTWLVRATGEAQAEKSPTICTRHPSTTLLTSRWQDLWTSSSYFNDTGLFKDVTTDLGSTVSHPEKAGM